MSFESLSPDICSLLTSDLSLQMIAKACPEYSLTKPSTLVAVSGAGNVAQFTALKVIELGGTVVSLSDSKGSLIAIDGGFSKEVVQSIGTLKLKGGSLESFTSFASDQKYKYYPGKACASKYLFLMTEISLPSRPTTLDFAFQGTHRPSRCYPERGIW